jgi:hypothetical protein
VLALGLVAVFSVRTAILISVIPGLLAALAIVYAIRHARLPAARERRTLRIRVRPVLHGQLGRLLGAFALFEIGNLAATLLILRATDLLAPARGHVQHPHNQNLRVDQVFACGSHGLTRPFCLDGDLGQLVGKRGDSGAGRAW